MNPTRRLFSAILAFLMIASLFAQIAVHSFAEATEIADYGGYSTILRKKSDGSILFSPNLAEVKTAVTGGAALSEFTIRMTFTQLSASGGTEVYTFPQSAPATLNASNWYYDVYLKGSKGDCGFCPTAGKYYNIYVEVYRGSELFCYGTYTNIQAPSGISSSSYYVPTQIPTEAQQLSETKAGFTGAVYPGSAFISDADGIYFAAYMTEFRTAIDGGAAVSSYTVNLEITKMKNGQAVYAFDTIIGASIVDAGSYFKVPLKTADLSLFCPQEDAEYLVSAELSKDAKEFYGDYAGATAAADVSSSPYYEPTAIAKEIAARTVYGGGLRQKSNGAILFSPFAAELRALISGGAAYADFTTKLTFSLVEDGAVSATWAPVTVTLGSSNGQYFDAVLQGSGVDCGFCPTAGSVYNVYAEIYKQDELLFYGVYANLTAAAAISGSSYYRPSPVPGAPIEYDMTLSYGFFNDLKGSAAGIVDVTSDGDGYFEVKWLDANGDELTVTAGSSVLSYAPLFTFVFTEDGEESLSHTVLPFTAIPQGAARIGAFDSNGTPVATCDLPLTKLLDAEDYSYSFGVLSDLHYSQFHATADDDADAAVANALSFFKNANVALVTGSGDYGVYAEEISYQKLSAAIENAGVTFLGCGGNHERNPGVTMFDEDGFWRTYMNKGVYDDTPMEGVLDIAPNGIDFVYEIPGKTDSVFIFLSQWAWDGHTAAQKYLVTESQTTWLAEQFETYKDRTVFFYFHVYLFDDDGETFDGEGDLTGPAGATYGQGYNPATPDEAILRSLLTEYKNVIWFNGHSHYLYEMQKYNPNLNVYDYEGTTATMIHVPSVTAPRSITDTSTSLSSMNGSASEGGLTFVYDGYEIMNGIDFKTGRILSEACYIIYNDKTGIVETETSGGVTATYDEQTGTLRFEGEGTIPQTLATAAQAYAPGVRRIYVGRGITLIPADAFSGFTALDTVEIKETVTSIGSGAFAGCTALSSFIYGGSETDFAALEIGGGNAALTDAARRYDQYAVTWVVGEETSTEQVRHYVVPSFDGKPVKLSEDGMQIYAFTGWKTGSTTYAVGKTLPKVTGNVTYTALFSATAEDRYVSGTLAINTGIVWSLDRYTGELTVTGTGAMDNYTRYTVDNPTLTPWRPYASEITSVYVGGGVTAVGAYAFADLTLLKSVICGVSVKTLGSDSFSYDSSLESLCFHAPITSVGQGTVYSSGNLKNVGLVGQTSEQFLSIAARYAYNDSYSAAVFTAHTLEDVAAVPATCTEEGTSAGFCCRDCLRVVGGVEAVPASGHSFGEWTVTSLTTFEEGGSRTRACEVCGETETENFAKAELGAHTDVIVGETNGKSAITFVGSISATELDPECVDGIALTLTFRHDGQIVNTKTVFTHNIFKTVSGVASVNATAVSQGIAFVENADYIFAVRISGVPEGSYTLTASVSAELDGESVDSHTAEYDFTVG